MEKSIKLLAAAIISGCLLVSMAIVVKSFIDTRYDRYYFSRATDGHPMVFDNATGKYYFYNPNTASKGFYQFDVINERYDSPR